MSLRSPQVLGSALFAVALLAFFYFVPGRESQTAKQAAIYEAVLRTILDKPDIRSHSPNETVCIANDKNLLDRNILQRLQGNSFQLAWVASAEDKARRPGSSGAKAPTCAAVLYVGEIRWQNRNEADVVAGYGCGPLCGYSGILHVRRTGWDWHVESVSDTLISEFFHALNVR
jgi:hypothetical protein